MRQKSVPVREPAEQVLKDIRRAAREHFSAEDKIRIVLEGLRGEDSIAELCRREGIVQNLYYRWSKDFLFLFGRHGGEGRARQDGQVGTCRVYARTPTRPLPHGHDVVPAISIGFRCGHLGGLSR
jgi:transposase